jgi:chemotaxis signal transduction protein
VKYYGYSGGNCAAGKMFVLRNRKIPIIDCFKRFGLLYTGYAEDRQTVVIIRPEGIGFYKKDKKKYAVLIDDLDENTIFMSRIGYAVPPQEGHVFADFTRECGDAVGGGQLMFFDWRKLALKH